MSFPFEKLTIKVLDGIGSLGRQGTKQKRNFLPRDALYLGRANDLYRPTRKENVSLSTQERLRHLYILGATGSGKTKLIESLIRQDILSGRGFTLIDPHGDLYESILKYLSDNSRSEKHACAEDYLAKKLVLVEPSNQKWCVGFNPLEREGANPYAQVLEFMGIFKKLWKDAYWGPRMEEQLRNTLITLSLHDLTLLEAKALLTNASFRNQLVAALPHGDAREYWLWRYDPLSEKMQATYREPLLNRLSVFVAEPSIRLMVGQLKSTINLRKILDSGQWLLVNLSKGQLKSNAHLLGGLLIAKLQLGALSRVDLPEANRTPHFVYVDEFQNFLSEDFETILSEARKYGLGLIMAHQNIDQLDRQLKSAILGNTLTQVFFRLSHQDASVLAAELSEREKPIIQRRLIDLQVGEAYIKKKGDRPRLMKTFHVPCSKGTAEAVENLRNLSLAAHGQLRSKVEAEIAERAAMIASQTKVQTTAARENDPYEGRFAPAGQFAEGDEW